MIRWRTFAAVLALTLASASLAASDYDAKEVRLLHKVQSLSFDLARYSYLADQLPVLSMRGKAVAEQFISFAENEMGLYDQAVLSFPIKLKDIPDLTLPEKSHWTAVDASDEIIKLAADRHIVMINEAHHSAHTRMLMLTLLPRLRAMGFGYFAAEALNNGDTELMKRGYPVQDSGTEYLHEPIYGQLVREAIRLGFKIVPYESAERAMELREAEQATHLVDRVFKHNPKARLVVQTGYAHIDHAKGRLGNTETLAMRLKDQTGYLPLSVDQTQFLEVGFNQADDYHQLAQRFKPGMPVILVNRTDGQPWSASPNQYDANVILPPAVSLKAFGEIKTSIAPPSLFTPTHRNNEMIRPAWLSLGGARFPKQINASMCKNHFPCLVEALFADESNDAVAADRYVFFEPYTASKLFLWPGRYRLRALDTKQVAIYEKEIIVSGK